MPCLEIGEKLQVVLDRNEQLISYCLSKISCGKAVGVEPFLLDRLKGRTATELMAMTPDDFRRGLPVRTEIEQFIGLKHFIALKSALEALTGRQAAGADATCAVEKIIYDGDRLVVTANIAIDLIAEKIDACGGCGVYGLNDRIEPEEETFQSG